jgi:hypothetical protein
MYRTNTEGAKGEAKFICSGHAINQHPYPIPASDCINFRLRIGGAVLLCQAVEVRFIAETAIDAPQFARFDKACGDAP